MIEHICFDDPCLCTGDNVDVLYFTRQQKERWPMTDRTKQREALEALLEAAVDDTEAVWRELDHDDDGAVKAWIKRSSAHLAALDALSAQAPALAASLIAMSKALEGERRAHGHRRICTPCQSPAQPGNACPKWHEMMKDVNSDAALSTVPEVKE